MDKKTMISEQTRQALKSSFLELYAKNGISGVTVGAITKKAGYNRCTFYNYYNDVYDLLEEIESTILLEITQKLETTILDIGIGNMNEAFEHFLYFFETYGNTIYTLLSKSGDSGFRRRFKETAFLFYRKILPDEIDSKEIEYLMCYVVSAGLGLIEHWYETGKECSTQEFVKLAQSLLMNGILGKIR